MLNMFFFIHAVCSTEPLLISPIIFPSVDIPVELFNKPDCEYTDDQKQLATTVHFYSPEGLCISERKDSLATPSYHTKVKI